jgi:hypothetical protein
MVSPDYTGRKVRSRYNLMPFPTFNPLNVKSLQQLMEAFNRFQNQIVAFTNAINLKPQLDTIVLTNVILNQGNNSVPHTLGYPCTNWCLTDNQGLGFVYRYAPSNNTTLFLYATQPMTVNLEVW